MEEDEETLEALEHLGQGLLSLVARLQPGVDLVVPRDQLGEGEEEGEAGGDGHPVQVVGELGEPQAGDAQEVEENPAKHEDKLIRRIISVCQDISANLPYIESSEDSVKQQDPAPGISPPHCHFLDLILQYETQIYIVIILMFNRRSMTLKSSSDPVLSHTHNQIIAYKYDD